MWLLFVALSALVRVEGESDCPAPAEVSAALERLEGAAVAASGSVRLATDGDSLDVRWIDDAGRTVRQWRFPRGGSCAALAETVALVLAVWRGGVDGAGLRSPPLPPPPVEGVPAPALRAMRPARPSLVAYEVAAGFLVGWEPGAGGSFGGTVEATVGPRESRWAGRVALSALSLQSQGFALGSVGWTRPSLSLGARLRLARERVRLDLTVDALVALLVLRGDGFAGAVAESYDVDPGLDLGLRLGVRAGPLVPFVDLRGVGWLRQQTARVTGIAAGDDLPRFDLWLTVGLAVAP